jgi:peptide/nickel transport system substrate-binding protein
MTTLTVLSRSAFTTFDPARSTFIFDEMLFSCVHRRLYAYRPGEMTTPVPDLAEAAPRVSPDGLSMIIALRRDVNFGPPVDREVLAWDVAHGLERALRPGVSDGHVYLYLRDIEGVSEFRAGEASSVSGIFVRDVKTLELRLTRPTSAMVTKALALSVSAPVPADWADEAGVTHGLARGGRDLCSGPYMIQSSSTENGIGETVLVRNPRWASETDWRPAYVDRIVVRHGHDDHSGDASAQIIRGEGMVNGDFMPPADFVRAIRETTSAPQVSRVRAMSGTCRYIALNTTVSPFDDVNVRRAVCAAVDRNAMLAPRYGSDGGDIATHIIPPGVLGFEEAGGLDGPDFDFLRSPAGDLGLAASYLRRAGYRNGRLSDVSGVAAVGSDTGGAREASRVAASQLRALGLEVDLEQVPTGTMYALCGDAGNRIGVYPSVGWVMEFPEPEAILLPLFDPEATQSTNWSRFQAPTLTRLIDAARQEVEPSARARAWADVDIEIMNQVPMIPLDWGIEVNIRSRDVQGLVSRTHGMWDLPFCWVDERHDEPSRSA